MTSEIETRPCKCVFPSILKSYVASVLVEAFAFFDSGEPGELPIETIVRRHE